MFESAAQHSLQADGRLARLVRNLPPGTSHLSSGEAVADYLGLLDQVLLDRYVRLPKLSFWRRRSANWV